MLTADQLKAISPNISDVHIATYLPLFNLYLPKYEINSKPRISAFLANVFVESDNLNATKEYASGIEYEHRTDLGNVNDGDGVKFKGRSLLQLTGRTNYHLCSQYMYGDDRLLANPALLEAPEGAVIGACWFWTVYKKINQFADLPDTWHHPGPHQYSPFQWICILINGGFNSYNQRLMYYQKAQAILQ